MAGHLAIPPQRDETLSSWLYRQSKLHGLPPQSYTSISFPSIEIWTRDIDRWLPESSMMVISESTRMPLSQVASMTLAGKYSEILGGIKSDGVTSWLLPVGVYHRQRKRHGQQFCPICFQQRAMLKLKWRLGFVSVCEDHKALLIDGCQVCGQPLTMFYVDPLRSTVCSGCGKRLNPAADTQKPKRSTGRSEFVELCASFSGRIFSHRNADKSPALAVNADLHGLRALLSVQLNKNQGRRMHKTWSARFCLPPVQAQSGRIEFLRSRCRHRLIAISEMALRQGTEEIVQDLVEHGVTRECIAECQLGKSAWLATHVIPHLKSNQRAPKSPPGRKGEMIDPLLSLRRMLRHKESRVRAQARACRISSMLDKSA